MSTTKPNHKPTCKLYASRKGRPVKTQIMLDAEGYETLNSLRDDYRELLGGREASTSIIVRRALEHLSERLHAVQALNVREAELAALAPHLA